MTIKTISANPPLGDAFFRPLKMTQQMTITTQNCLNCLNCHEKKLTS